MFFLMHMSSYKEASVYFKGEEKEALSLYMGSKGDT